MKRIIPLIVAALCISDLAFAQHWQKLTTPWTPEYMYYQVPYFLNSDIGFVFVTTNRYSASVLTLGNPHGISTGRIFRTTNGGASWTRIHPFDSTEVSIQQLCFTSLSHGFALIDSTSANGLITGIIYETSDTGNSWKRITAPDFSAYSVYSAGDKIFATGAEPSVLDFFAFPTIGLFPYQIPGKLFVSGDDGRSWTAVAEVPGTDVGQVMGNRDSLVYCMSTDYLGTFLTSSRDLGAHWAVTPLDPFSSGGVFPVLVEMSIEPSPYSCDVARAWVTDSESLADVISIYTGNLSTPKVSWKKIVTQELGGWIAGTDCARYYSNANSLPNLDTGLYRLTGNTIAAVGNTNLLEIDDDDYANISVVGHGAVVYVGNPNQNSFILKTTDGGDGALSEAALAPQFSLAYSLSGGRTDSLIACTSGTVTVIDHNNSCSHTLFSGFSITGLDSSEYSITRTHHLLCDNLPDTTSITVMPLVANLRNIHVVEHFTDDEFNTVDTGFTFILNSVPKTPIAMYLKAEELTPASGDTITIPVYLSGVATFTGADITLPFTLDTNRMRVIGFFPALSGVSVANQSYEQGTETIRLQTTQFTVSGEVLLGKLRCIVYLSDTITSSVKLSGGSFSGQGPGCTLLSVGSGSMDFSISGCGAKTISEFLRNDELPAFTIHPNPASMSFQVLAQHLHLPCTYELSDALGTTRKKWTSAQSSMQIDISDLPAGNYYLLMHAEGFFTTKHIVVTK